MSESIRFEEVQERMSASIQAVARAFDRMTVTVEVATGSLIQLKRALVTADAHWQAGDWPDMFSLINRYLRTGVLPENLEGVRWEA